MGDFLYRELTSAIIGAAMEVHREIGGGLLENVYENSLAHEFDLRDIPYERQKEIRVTYKGKPAGFFRVDFVVEELVIVELKSLSAGMNNAHYAQIINYLKASGLKVGLLINFGKPSLKYKRFVESKNPRKSE